MILVLERDLKGTFFALLYIAEDPAELSDLAPQHPQLVASLWESLSRFETRPERVTFAWMP